MPRKLCMTLDWQGAQERKQILRRVEIADRVGVDTIWVAEAWGRDAFSLLTQLAERTTRIQLGTGIVNIYSRTPAALAQHFATLDELSGGRAVAGFGTSGPQVIEHFHGVPFRPAVARLRETVEIFNRLIASEPLKYSGRLFKLERGFTLRFQPVRPHIPVWIASLNPGALAITAELADGWMPVMIPRRELGGEIAAFRARVTAAGRAPGAVAVRSPDRALVALEERKTAERQAAGTLAFYIARMGTFYGAQLERFGFGEAVRGVREAWKKGGTDAGIDAVPETLRREITTVGSVAECAAALDEESRSGVDLHNVGVQARSEAEYERALIDLVGA